MKKWLLFLLAAISISGVRAEGIHFETGTWKETLDKAKLQNRLIYLDVYTTWCGPCKMMAAKIFPTKEAGDKYNALFVNYKIDAEKGEGIGLAKQFEVTGYPTNLYIDPKTEKIVYRVIGAPMDVATFNERADIASLEYQDPMLWEDYLTTFEKGSREKAFLRRYLEKAARLEKNNDDILDAYVSSYVSGTPDDSTLQYLLRHTKTFDNDAFLLLEKNEQKINARFQNQADYFKRWAQNLTFSTVEKAAANHQETLLDKIEKLLERYDPEGLEQGLMFQVRKSYYQQIRDGKKMWEISVNEANFLTGKSMDTYNRENERQLKEAKEIIRTQLRMMNVPDSLHESSVRNTIAQHPRYTRMSAYSAASTLNESAWRVYEKNAALKDYLTQALSWSEKSVQLAEGLPDFLPVVADTYAHLLYISGQQAKAIAIQEQAVNTIKALEDGDTDLEAELEAELQKMKDGTL